MVIHQYRFSIMDKAGACFDLLQGFCVKYSYSFAYALNSGAGALGSQKNASAA